MILYQIKKYNELLKVCIAGDLESLKRINSEEKIDISFPIVNTICSCGHLELLKFLFEIGMKVSIYDYLPLKSSTFREHFNLLKYICENRQINGALKKGIPFFTACSTGNCEIIEYILNLNGTDVSVRHSLGLVKAISSKKLNAVKLLIQRGIKIENESGYIYYSIIKRSRDITMYLRNLFGNKIPCYNCIVAPTCMEVCNKINEERYFIPN